MVNTLLKDFLPKIEPDEVDEDLIITCIEISGMLPALAKFVNANVEKG
jgi:hypothetical protein